LLIIILSKINNAMNFYSEQNDNNNEKIHLLTVCTNQSSASFQNWKYSFEKSGFTEITAKGHGEDFVSWNWRTQKYLEALTNMPKDCIVLITDADDVLCVGSHDEILHRFKALNAKIVVSAEKHQIAGPFIHKNVRKALYKALNYKLQDPNVHTSGEYAHTEKAQGTPLHRSVCAGLIIGYASSLLPLLKELLKSEDDQAQLQLLFLGDNTSRIKLDSGHVLFDNAILGGSNAAIEYVREFFGSNNATQRCTVDQFYYVQSDNAWPFGIKFVRKGTNETPLVIHFPGKLTCVMNAVISVLGTSTIQQATTETNQSHQSKSNKSKLKPVTFRRKAVFKLITGWVKGNALKLAGICIFALVVALTFVLIYFLALCKRQCRWKPNVRT
jgi:hypothetical protein